MGKVSKDWNPPVAFYFQIEFAKQSGIPDMEFMEISGLTVEMETEEVEEGGEIRFKHKIPVRFKHGNLICKRALSPLKDSALSKWIKGTLEGDLSLKIKPSNAFVSLLGKDKNKICGWFLTNLFPIKWDIGAFDSKKNELAIESIEFSYNTIERKL